MITEAKTAEVAVVAALRVALRGSFGKPRPGLKAAPRGVEAGILGPFWRRMSTQLWCLSGVCPFAKLPLRACLVKVRVKPVGLVAYVESSSPAFSVSSCKVCYAETKWPGAFLKVFSITLEW